MTLVWLYAVRALFCPYGAGTSGQHGPNFILGAVLRRPIQIYQKNLNGGKAENGTWDKVRAMLARCYGPTGMKKRPDSRKLFERKNSNIHLQNDNFHTGCQTGPVR